MSLLSRIVYISVISDGNTSPTEISSIRGPSRPSVKSRTSTHRRDFVSFEVDLGFGEGVDRFGDWREFGQDGIRHHQDFLRAQIDAIEADFGGDACAVADVRTRHLRNDMGRKKRYTRHVVC